MIDIFDMRASPQAVIQNRRPSEGSILDAVVYNEQPSLRRFALHIRAEVC